MTAPNRRESGSALLVAMMLLVLMGLIGLAALQTVSQDRQVAGYQNRARLALYAADASVALVSNLLRDPKDCTTALVVPSGTLGDGMAYPYGQPSYGPDPEVATPIRCVGKAPPDPSLGVNLTWGRARFQSLVWEVHSLGQTADGSSARVETRQTGLSGSQSYN